MPDDKCKWKSKYHPGYECYEPPFDEKGWCILHSEKKDKNIGEFTRKIEERMAVPDKIDLIGCCFPKGFRADYFERHTFAIPVDFSEATFSQAANFRRAKFSQEANFSGATFSEAYFFMAEFSKKAYFCEATFSQEAVFIGATFSEAVDFIMATFSKAANFGWATFSKRAVFSGAAFEKGVTFDRAEFMDNAFFRPAELEAEGGGKEIQEVNLGDPTSFRRTRFPGEVVFQQVDLRHCSFLHSNIDKVDFRYCKFGEEKGRQNVLKDERDADKKDVGTALAAVRMRTGTSPVPTEMRAGASPAPTGKGVREEKYEPVRRLYLELKKNFEDKRDWNTAGDFHYGEMECRRKMREGWLWRNILSLEAVYFWLSGYGERPLKAAVSLGLLIGICAVLYVYFEGLISRFEGDYVRAFLKSGCDSLKIATLQRIGDVYEPFYLPAKILFVFESIMGPILITLLALALRRRVKR